MALSPPPPQTGVVHPKKDFIQRYRIRVPTPAPKAFSNLLDPPRHPDGLEESTPSKGCRRLRMDDLAAWKEMGARCSSSPIGFVSSTIASRLDDCITKFNRNSSRTGEDHTQRLVTLETTGSGICLGGSLARPETRPSPDTSISRNNVTDQVMVEKSSRQIMKADYGSMIANSLVAPAAMTSSMNSAKSRYANAEVYPLRSIHGDSGRAIILDQDRPCPTANVCRADLASVDINQKWSNLAKSCVENNRLGPSVISSRSQIQMNGHHWATVSPYQRPGMEKSRPLPQTRSNRELMHVNDLEMSFTAADSTFPSNTELSNVNAHRHRVGTDLYDMRTGQHLITPAVMFEQERLNRTESPKTEHSGHSQTKWIPDSFMAEPDSPDPLNYLKSEPVSPYPVDDRLRPQEEEEETEYHQSGLIHYSHSAPIHTMRITSPASSSHSSKLSGRSSSLMEDRDQSHSPMDEEEGTKSRKKDKKKVARGTDLSALIPACCPLDKDQIVNLSMDDFNEKAALYGFSDELIATCKEVRRKGKNRHAAFRSRKKKMDNIERLVEKRDFLRQFCEQLKNDLIQLRSVKEKEERRLMILSNSQLLRSRTPLKAVS